MKRLLSLVLSFYVTDLFAWGSFGHQTAGEIAERYLTPQARIALNELLGPEKLAYTSTWADMVREDQDFDQFKFLHYVDLHHSDARAALNNFPLLLANPEVERSVKILALRYLVHIVQDVHQPLHAGIKDDAGGNFCNIEWLPGQTLNLHQVWDGKIIDYDVIKLKISSSPLKYFTFTNYADEILKENPLNQSEIESIQATPSADWIKESQDLEKEVYPEDPVLTNYCKKNVTTLPKITTEYKDHSVKITRKRIHYAGLRLASLLNQIFKDQSNSGKNSTLDKNQILQKLIQP